MTELPLELPTSKPVRRSAQQHSQFATVVPRVPAGSGRQEGRCDRVTSEERSGRTESWRNQQPMIPPAITTDDPATPQSPRSAPHPTPRTRLHARVECDDLGAVAELNG